MTSGPLNQVRHHNVVTNDVRVHCAELGEGPLVILVHGFPESWYSWRNQLPALAAAGYRAVAIDVRGYGRTSSPRSVDEYRMIKMVGDIVGLVGALGEDQATLIGHDWGAPIVWNSALLRPDLFRGVAGLSVPYNPRGNVRPLAAFRLMAGKDEFYIEYFQQPGRAETEIERDVRGWLLGFYHCASGDVVDGPNIAMVERGTQLRDKFVYPEAMPSWLTDADLDIYAGEFERSGFSGGLNRYRNVDRDWEDLAAFENRPIEVPALFVGGSRDGPTVWGGSAIERFAETLPALTKSVIIDGSGHWIQQERAEQTNVELLEFLGRVH